jgi:hypothetical protein
VSGSLRRILASATRESGADDNEEEEEEEGAEGAFSRGDVEKKEDEEDEAAVGDWDDAIASISFCAFPDCPF